MYHLAMQRASLLQWLTGYWVVTVHLEKYPAAASTIYTDAKFRNSTYVRMYVCISYPSTPQNTTDPQQDHGRFGKVIGFCPKVIGFIELGGKND